MPLLYRAPGHPRRAGTGVLDLGAMPGLVLNCSCDPRRQGSLFRRLGLTSTAKGVKSLCSGLS